MSQNFRLFHVSNLSVRNFRIFLLMYPGPVFCFVPGAARDVPDVLEMMRRSRRMSRG